MLTSLILTFFMNVYINPDLVRYGDFHTFKEGDKVAVVDSKKVYESFKEYKIILKENLKPGTARYTHLMSTCTTKYKNLLKKHAYGQYVLVVELGGVKDYKTTNITHSIIGTKVL